WDTEEVTDLIEWMRAYNEQQPDEKKVRFLGYDVQRVNEGITFLRDYLGKVAPSLGGQVEPVFDILWEGDIARPSQLQVRDELSRAQSLISLYSLIGYLTTHRVRLVRDSSVSEWRAAVEYAKNILRYYDS